MSNTIRYAYGNLKTENLASTRPAIARLLEKYRASGDGRNIVHVVHETPAGAAIFTSGTPLADEFEELQPKATEKLVVKKHPSSFAGTDLHEYLISLGAVGKRIVITGYMAHVCVSTTARVAEELGYDVLMVEDAIGDRNIRGIEATEVKYAVLKELDDAFATVIMSADID